ncbi:MAG: B12-binding domain-containing radical SAM protein [Desulfobacteraceae bacterium]|nr:B12-binding domain-containing radical SAM protein [Desulfobacteraceae bacterium]
MNNRVFLLNPPTLEPATAFPLGLAYLSSSLRNNGYDVKVMDAGAAFSTQTPDDIRNAIKDYDPIFVGVTLKYDHIPLKYELVRSIQDMGFKVVCGGPHVNILPNEALENGCNIVSIGEGDLAVLDIADAIATKRDLSTVDGIAFKKENNEFEFTHRRARIEDLDTIPFPDYSDYNISDYLGGEDATKDRTFFDVFSSRGCPFRCTYCSAGRIWHGGQRNRSAQNVFEEVKYLVEEYGAKYIAFMDNEPLVDIPRMYEFCDLLEKSKLNVKISTRARIDNIDEGLLRRMMEVGFYRIAVGVESGDEETLKKVHRFYTQDDVIEALEKLDRVNFPAINFNNLIGFPWENKSHFENTLRMNERVPSGLTYFVNVLTPMPLPGTPLYSDYCDEFGFKDWWLKTENHEVFEPEEKNKKFYQIFLPILRLEFYRVDFWKYTKEMKKLILNYHLKYHAIAYNQNKRFSSLEIAITFLFIKLAVFADLISPRLERVLFAPLKNRWVLNYAKKYRFKEQE